MMNPSRYMRKRDPDWVGHRCTTKRKPHGQDPTKRKPSKKQNPANLKRKKYDVSNRFIGRASNMRFATEVTTGNDPFLYSLSILLCTLHCTIVL